MESLIEAARAGDRSAMEELLRHVAPAVHRFGMRMCRNEADAQDVMQDTLLFITGHLRDFGARASFTSWVFTLARTACARRRRGLKNRTGEGDGALVHEIDSGHGPEHEVDQRQVAAMLASALDALPHEYREVVALRDVEGLSAKEAAEVLNLSVDALKSRLHRARAALREKLTPLLEPVPTRALQGCPDVVHLLSQRLEGELSAETCAAVEQHVADCPSCGASCEALRTALSECAREREQTPSATVRAAIGAAISACAARAVRP